MLRRLKEIMKIKTKGKISFYLSHTEAGGKKGHQCFDHKQNKIEVSTWKKI